MKKELAEIIMHEMNQDLFLARAVATYDVNRVYLEMLRFDNIDARRLLEICKNHRLFFEIKGTEGSGIKIMIGKYN